MEQGQCGSLDCCSQATRAMWLPDSRDSFLLLLEAGRLSPRCQQGQVLVKTSLTGCGSLPSRCSLTWQKEGERALKWHSITLVQSHFNAIVTGSRRSTETVSSWQPAKRNPLRPCLCHGCFPNSPWVYNLHLCCIFLPTYIPGLAHMLCELSRFSWMSQLTLVSKASSCSLCYDIRCVTCITPDIQNGWGFCSLINYKLLLTSYFE